MKLSIQIYTITLSTLLLFCYYMENSEIVSVESENSSTLAPEPTDLNEDVKLDDDLGMLLPQPEIDPYNFDFLEDVDTSGTDVWDQAEQNRERNEYVNSQIDNFSGLSENQDLRAPNELDINHSMFETQDETRARNQSGLYKWLKVFSE